MMTGRENILITEREKEREGGGDRGGGVDRERREGGREGE